MKNMLALLIAFAAGATAFGQIGVTTEKEFTFKPYRAIELASEVEIKDGFEVARIQWRTRSIEVDLRPHDNGRTCSVWASPGTYEIMLDAWLVNWEAKEFDGVERIFTITVEGARPPPEPEEPDVPDPVETSGEVWSIVIRVASEMTESQSTTLLEIREWADNNETKVTHYEFSPDAETIDGSPDSAVTKYVDMIPAGSFYPYGFLLQENDAGKAIVKWQGEINSAADVIDQAKGLVN